MLNYSQYSNEDGQIVRSPISYPGDKEGQDAVNRYEAQHQRFHHPNVNAREPNYGPKDGLDEKREWNQIWFKTN